MGVVERLHSQAIKAVVYLLEQEWEETSIGKSYTTGQLRGSIPRGRDRDMVDESPRSAAQDDVIYSLI